MDYMQLTEKDRESLIEYRLNQATENLELARFLVSNNKLTIAVNRIYYGIYYALTSLALKNKYETSKHGQLIGWFNKVFILSGKADKKYGKILRSAYQNRTKGDYDAFVSFSMQDVDPMLTEMADFILEINRLLKE